MDRTVIFPENTRNKHCVELHGDTIAFATELGNGTTFTVTLPVFHSESP
jgi:signal transduction histidine kinase